MFAVSGETSGIDSLPMPTEKHDAEQPYVLKVIY